MITSLHAKYKREKVEKPYENPQRYVISRTEDLFRQRPEVSDYYQERQYPYANPAHYAFSTLTSSSTNGIGTNPTFREAPLAIPFVHGAMDIDILRLCIFSARTALRLEQCPWEILSEISQLACRMDTRLLRSLEPLPLPYCFVILSAKASKYTLDINIRPLLKTCASHGIPHVFVSDIKHHFGDLVQPLALYSSYTLDSLMVRRMPKILENAYNPVMEQEIIDIAYRNALSVVNETRANYGECGLYEYAGPNFGKDVPSLDSDDDGQNFDDDMYSVNDQYSGGELWW